MNRLPNPKEILTNTYNTEESELDLEIALCCNKEIIISMLREYGRAIRDETLKWAAENAEIEYEYRGYYKEAFTAGIDKKSILAGKDHKDLEI